MNASGPREFTLTGRHVLGLTLVFFSIIFAANAAFLTFAISTNTGVVSDEPYRKGLRYNERIADDDYQLALAWSSKVTVTPGGQELTAQISEANGAPVRGYRVSAVIGRPATMRENQTLTLSENSPGFYATPLPDSLSGAYIGDIQVSKAGESHSPIVYRTRRRLWIEP